MAAKAKASDEGTQVETVAEQVQGTPAPAAEPEQQQDDQKPADGAGTALAPQPEAPLQQSSEPGLPSPHQLHAKNWIEKTRVDWQTFKLGHDALVTELNGLDAAHDEAQAKRKAEFDAETKRVTDDHDKKREELVSRINDMLDGLAVTEGAIEHYNERMTPETKNIREDEQQESEQ